jgi:hypothetical protein
MKTLALFRLLLPALLTTLAACSSSSGDKPNAAPVIDSIDAPAEATQQQGQWAVTFTIMFHDADKDAITNLKYKVVQNGLTGSAQPQGTNPDAVGAKLTLLVPGTVQPGTYEIAFTVVDARGAESAPVSKSVTLK